MSYIRFYALHTAVLVFILSLFSLTPLVEAYFTTDQQAQTLTENTIMFSVSYKFGHNSYDIEMPALTQRSTDANNDLVSYQIYNEEGNVPNGTTMGVVFSNALLTQTGMYSIPQDTSASLQLIVLFTPESTDGNELYRLEVEHLPFTLDGSQNKLNEPELRPYVTPYTSSQKLKITL